MHTEGLFICIGFLLCGRITNGVPQALKLFQNKAFSCEYKYAFFLKYIVSFLMLFDFPCVVLYRVLMILITN